MYIHAMYAGATGKELGVDYYRPCVHDTTSIVDLHVFLLPGVGELLRMSSDEVLRETGGTSTSMRRNLYGPKCRESG